MTFLCAWLIKPNIMISNSTHAVTNTIFPSFHDWIVSHSIITFSLSVHHIGSVDGYLGCFYLLALVNSAAINMSVKIHLQDLVFIFWIVYPAAELSAHIAILFSMFLKNCHTFFHSRCVILLSSQYIQEFQFLPILTNSCYFILLWLF